MECMVLLKSELIDRSYRLYHKSLYHYIYNATNGSELSEDMVQDVFLKLIEYEKMLLEDTVKSFIFSIAKNIVKDYNRRRNVIEEYNSYYNYIFDECMFEDTSSRMIVNDILEMERRVVSNLPLQRRKVYELVRYEEKNAMEVSVEMNLSIKTVQNHLLAGRKYVREYISKCI